VGRAGRLTGQFTGCILHTPAAKCIQNFVVAIYGSDGPRSIRRCVYKLNYQRPCRKRGPELPHQSPPVHVLRRGLGQQSSSGNSRECIVHGEHVAVQLRTANGWVFQRSNQLFPYVINSRSRTPRTVVQSLALLII
jgi:hypothetical protein